MLRAVDDLVSGDDILLYTFYNALTRLEQVIC